MRRELPSHPHIEHLKKQAKDLVDGHRRAEAEALDRIIRHLPAFARLSPDEAARAPFALHDAQSTIAREYGFASWSDLRAEVQRRASPAVPDSLLRAMAGRPLPGDVTAALQEAWDARGPALAPSRASLPLLALRDALLTPGAVAPIRVARPASLAAVAAAMAAPPSLIAVITQRDTAVEVPRLEDLHPVGCVATVKKRVDSQPGVYVVLEGQWWAELEVLEESTDGDCARAVVHPCDAGDDLTEPERAALFDSLRERAHALARGMPQPERVVALVDSVRTLERLSDLIVANLPVPVEDKVRYASRPTLRDRLRAAIALCDAMIAASAAPR